MCFSLRGLDRSRTYRDFEVPQILKKLKESENKFLKSRNLTTNYSARLMGFSRKIYQFSEATPWNFHLPQFKTPWNFRILRFNTTPLEIPLSSTRGYTDFRRKWIVKFGKYFLCVYWNLKHDSRNTFFMGCVPVTVRENTNIQTLYKHFNDVRTL